MATPTYTKAGAKATTVAKLDDAVFDVDIKNHELLKQVYDAYLANGRLNLAVVKTRGLVRGGGKKPWKQKGTGRARFGSSRNPIWRGGGIVFGPTGEENYSKHVNVKAKRLALRQALTMAAKNGNIIVIEDVTDITKTAQLSSLLQKVGVTYDNRTIVALENKTTELDLAARNLQGLKIVQSTYLNVYDVMNADKIVLTKAALTEVTERLKATVITKQADGGAK